MGKKLIVLAVLALAAACTFGVGTLADPDVGPPQVITAESRCPVTQCASGECHGFDAVPGPDGVYEMVCPEAGCASVECHAWDTLVGRYHQASDASLNLWILAPVVLVLGLTLFVRKVR